METLGIPENWAGLGISGIILFAIFALFRGWIMPASTVHVLLGQKDKVIETQDETIEVLMEVVAPTKKLLETLQSEASRDKVKADVDDS